mmetsp:Transcript_27875/g.81837  ORF Transcript_27875/g.81837 Transcript_27875/m.81837 type:complete len:201 (+) Transcript_27875:654-1256(+)
MSSNGYSELTLQMTVSRARLSKLLSVTPRYLVSAAPNSVPTVDAPLKMDMRDANNTASMPGGQSLAARTRVGRKANSPNIDNATSSPNTKAPSGIPNARFAWVMRRRLDSPRGAEAMDVQNSMSLMGIVRRYFWYAQTPTREERAVTNRTRPRNSGPNPRSLVMKYSMAPSPVGVDCHRKRKRAGFQMAGSRKAATRPSI